MYVNRRKFDATLLCERSKSTPFIRVFHHDFMVLKNVAVEQPSLSWNFKPG